MRWPEDAADWPMADYSRRVLCRPHRWHLQDAGTGDTLLLLHGAGGATQSFRHLFPLLSRKHRVIAIDLPGQGFTQSGARSRSGLDPMAEDIAALLKAEDIRPSALIGHSAGVPIALRLAEILGDRATPVVGINAALMSFQGLAGWLFPAMAKALALAPFTATLFAATMTDRRTAALLASTGSQIDAAGVALYRRLASDPGHVDGTLAMMAQWALDPLLARLPGIPNPVALLVGENDRTVAPDTSRRAAARLPNANVTSLGDLGHLAHEEDAARVARHIEQALS